MFRVIYSFLIMCVFAVVADAASTEPAELRLLKAGVEKSEGGVAISPWSLYESLKLILPGAAGETEKQIRAAMPPDWGGKREWHFMAAENGKLIKVAAFAGVFADSGVRIRAEYRSAVGAGNLMAVPLMENKSKAAAQINARAAAATEGRIKKLVAPAEIAPQSVIILGNAFYLQGIWNEQFKRENTNARRFIKEDGSEDEVMMMENKEVFRESSRIACQGGNYYEKDGVRAASLMMRGDLVFMAVLPPKGVKMKDFVHGVTSEQWRELLRELSKNNAAPPDAPAAHKHLSYALRLPRFNVNAGAFSLDAALQALGVRAAFTAQADFTRMGAFDGVPLKLQSVRQHCGLKVQEHGLEAVAKTNVDMMPFGGPLTAEKSAAIEFNRPFLWLIYSPRDEAVLLLGTYMGAGK